MSSGPAPPCVSVKFTPAGRTYTFLLPEFALDTPDEPQPLAVGPGERVVVQTPEGTAFGTVTRPIPALTERRSLPPDSPARVIRRATKEDVVTRLKQQQREQD